MKAIALFAAIAVTTLSLVQMQGQDGKFSVKDDIGMVRFSDPFPLSGLPSSSVAQQSPDGKHFMVVTTRALLDEDLIESVITVFDRLAVEKYLAASQGVQPPAPRVIAHVKSYIHHEQAIPYAPVIKDVRWAPNQRHLYFRGENLNGNYQLYEASVEGSQLHNLTPPDQSVNRFDLIGNRIVCRFSSPVDKYDKREWINADTELITGHSLREVLFTDELTTVNPELFKIEILSKQNGHWQRKVLPNYSDWEFASIDFLFPFSLSPLGDAVVAMTPFSEIPQRWVQYEPKPGSEMYRFGHDDPHRTDVTSSTRPQQYTLFDLARGRATALLNAPNARVLSYSDNNRAVWSEDGKRILLTNTFLELPTPVDRSSPRKMPCSVASVDRPDNSVRCLVFVDQKALKEKSEVAEVEFGRDTNHVSVLVHNAAGQYEVKSYGFLDGSWQFIASKSFVGLPSEFLRHKDASQATNETLTVVVQQGLNTPPTLWASDSATGKAKELWNPNSQLDHLRFGEASVYHWKDQTGDEWTGGLVKPVGYVPGKRYPFVIQMYNFEDGLFLTDGMDPSAFAARHLASVGFVVLQIQKKKTTVSPADIESSLRGYRSAIDSLSAAGLIDRSKGGVVGFSWTCWYAEDAIVRDPKLFAAATISDGLTNTYSEYELLEESHSGIGLQMEKIHGGMPVGDGLKRWVDTSNGFHMDQVTAPVRFEAMNALSVIGEWELYASLKMQEKPVDFVYFPHGTHIHQKPLERLESQQGSVDWFRFWLQGYEDPDPLKASQYKRWRELRELRDKAQRTARQDDDGTPTS